METVVKNEVSGKEYLVCSIRTWDTDLGCFEDYEIMVFEYDSTRNAVLSWGKMYVEYYEEYESNKMEKDYARVIDILKHEKLQINKHGYIVNLYEQL